MASRNEVLPPIDIEVPLELEQFILFQGPPLVTTWMEGVGGTIRAADVMGITPQTASRWLNHAVGDPFGGARSLTTLRSLWFGYPSPFSLLDRILEELEGNGESFLRSLVRRVGWEEIYPILWDQRFGIETLGYDRDDHNEACHLCQIPRTSAKRVWASCVYPQQWVGLDRLAYEIRGLPFLAAVLQEAPKVTRRRVPAAALAAWIDEIRRGSPAAIG